MVHDLTVGKPSALLIRFAAPMLLGSVFQQLYNTVDSVVVGRYVGKDALASVGAANPVMLITQAAMMGITVGLAVVIAQFFGAGEIQKLKSSMSTATIMCAVAAVIFTVIGMFIAYPVLRLTGVPENIIDDSAAYLQIVMLGMLFNMIYSCYAAALRGVGDSKTPVYFLVVSAVVNIVLDLLFVIRYGMGVKGVAIATVIAQFVSCILCVAFTYAKVSILRIPLREYRLDTASIRTVTRYGIPSALQQIVVSAGFLAVQGVVNSFGENIIAAYSAATKVDSFAILPIMNIGNSLSTFVGQNIGAGKKERVGQAMRASFKILLIFCIVLALAIVPFAKYYIMLFVGEEEAEVIASGVRYLTTVSSLYVTLAAMTTISSTFRGTGHMRMSMTMSFISLGVRVLAAYLLAGLIGPDALWWCAPIGWSAAAIFGLLWFRSGTWADHSLIKN